MERHRGQPLNLFLDACALIYRFEGADTFRQATARLLRELTRGSTTKARVAVSRLSMLECRGKPLRENDLQTLKRYDHFFSEIEIVEIDATVIELATRLRALHGLKTPDAIQAASALVWQADALFVTADAAFEKTPNLNVRLIRV